MGKKLIFEGCQDRVLHGLLQAVKAAEVTYGPYGKTVGLQKGNDLRLTKDGISVLKDVEFDDPTLEFGAIIAKETSYKANHISGDGSTSTAILTGSLSKSAHEILKSGIDINELRRGYLKALDDTLTQLKEFRMTLTPEQDPKTFIRQIALVSANGESEIADNVTEAFLSVGDGGVVQYAQSTSPTGKTKIVFSEGTEYAGTGYITSASCNNVSQDHAIYKDVAVLLFGETVNNAELLASHIKNFIAKKQKFMIIAPMYSEEVSAMLATRFAQAQGVGGIGTAVLIPGTTREIIDENLMDMSKLMGAKIIGRDVDFANVVPQTDFGHAGSIDVGERRITIVDPTPAPDFEKWINALADLRDSDDAANGISQQQRDNLRIRLGRLTGGIAMIYIGALTRQEAEEKKDRYEDALNAVKTALNSGYLVGGSSSLFKISGILKAPEDFTIGERAAYNAFVKALRRPCTLLIQSSGTLLEDVASDIKTSDKETGFNARTRKVENLVQSGIIDPYGVIYNSIRYATSGALQFASIGCLSIRSNANLQCLTIDELVSGDRGIIDE